MPLKMLKMHRHTRSGGQRTYIVSAGLCTTWLIPGGGLLIGDGTDRQWGEKFEDPE